MRLPMSSLLLLLLLITFLLLLPYTYPSNVDSPSRSVVLISVPLAGHLSPLLAQAAQLHTRGWKVYVASTTQMATLIMSNQNIQFIDLGSCTLQYDQLSSALDASSSHTEWLYSSFEIVKWVLSLYPCMYTALMHSLSVLPVKPDIMVVDFATTVGVDVAEEQQIPYIINNCNLLNMIGHSILTPLPYIPLLATATPSQQLQSLTVTSFLQRLLFPALTPFGYVLTMLQPQPLYEQAREAVGLPAVSWLHRIDKQVVLMNSAMPLEYSRPLPPNIIMVGTMIDHTISIEKHKQGLPEAETQLIQAESDQPVIVVYVSFGTIAPLSGPLVPALLQALFSLPQHYRILWKLPPSYYHLLPHELPPNLGVRNWFGSQLTILSHSHLFISHCGTNSLHEALYFSVPILCIPIQGDQGDNAQRVVDAGVGIQLDKTTITTQQLVSAVEALMANYSVYHEAALRLAACLRLAGGVQRAVDYIEHVATFGPTHFLPINHTQPWWMEYNIDIWLTCFVILSLLYVMFTKVICGGRNRATAPAAADGLGKQKTS